jgi:PAS domain S-box-containing protein
VEKPITLLIPPSRLHEEGEIIGRIRRGERLKHYDTIRIRKGGKSIHISVSVSPLNNAAGEIIGASKIARDITERKAAETRLIVQPEKMKLLQQITLAIGQHHDNPPTLFSLRES